MHAVIIDTGRTLGTARETLFGYNIEWISDVPAAISSERLANPTFLGPANVQSGLAEPWRKVMQFQGGIRFELEAGQNLEGGPAQRVHVYDHAATGGGAGPVQPHCWVRAGETLRVVLWARCQGEPVELRLGFRHRGLAGPDYASANVLVNASHIKRYEVVLAPMPVSDDNCLFFCYLTGNGIVYFDRISARPVDEPLHRADTLEAIRELQPGDIRWPGGCVSSSYHWFRGVGPEERRHDELDSTFFWNLCYTWGTAEYLDLCRQTGARPHVTLNISTATPAMAGEWAAYCADWYRRQGIEPPEMVFQIGNEHSGPHEVGHMTGPMYAQAVLDYAPEIRRNYPRAVIASLCIGEAWIRDCFAAGAQECLDLIVTHFYACRVDFNPVRESLAFLGDAAEYALAMDKLAAVIDECGGAQPTGVTEWGAFRGESHTDAKFYEPHTTRTSLFVAAMLNDFCRRAARIQLSNNYSLINTMPVLQARGSRVERTPIHQLFRFWRPCFPAEIIDIDNTSPTFVAPHSTNNPAHADIAWDAALADPAAPPPWESQDRPARPILPWLDALAGHTADSHWLLLTNRHPDEMMEVTLPARFAGADVDILLPNEDFTAYIASHAAIDGEAITIPPGGHYRIMTK
jgi:hypothetical protein